MSRTLRVGVVAFDAATDARHTAVACSLAGHEPVILSPDDATPEGVDAFILAGGFSSGDYVRPGILAARSPVMSGVAKAAAAGQPVLGIGNGFQILTEANLLPGGFVANESLKYHHTDTDVVITNASTPFTVDYAADQQIRLVHKAGYGQYVVSETELEALREAGQIVAVYADNNPNGSVGSVAGVANEAGNVVGLMVHPEYAIEEGFGTDSPEGPGMGIDGQGVFTSLSTFLTSDANSADQGAN